MTHNKVTTTVKTSRWVLLLLTFAAAASAPLDEDRRRRVAHPDARAAAVGMWTRRRGIGQAKGRRPKAQM